MLPGLESAARAAAARPGEGVSGLCTTPQRNLTTTTKTVSPDDRRDGARDGDSYDMITKSHPYVKCNPLALNATNNARKSSWSIFAGRFPSKRS